MNFHTREFVESDRPALRALLRDSRDATFVWDPPGHHRLEDFDRETVGETILVADRGGAVLGFASFSLDDHYLHHLYVHPDHLGEGLGGALLQRCQDLFAGDGLLKCLCANQYALGFYLSQGWEVLCEGRSADGHYLLLGQSEWRDRGGPGCSSDRPDIRPMV